VTGSKRDWGVGGLGERERRGQNSKSTN